MKTQAPDRSNRSARKRGSLEHRLRRWRDVRFFTDVDLTHLPPGRQRQVVQQALARTSKPWVVLLRAPLLLLLAAVAALTVTKVIAFRGPLPTITTFVLLFWTALAIVIYLLSRVFRHLLRPHILLALDSRCSACGYDLSGNTSGLCPECGREIAADKADHQRPLSSQ